MKKKIVTYVPVHDADAVRNAIAEAGGGILGKYTHCTFSIKGIGRFKPEAGANPHIGTVGIVESVEEDRIEVTCDVEVVNAVILAIKKVHPYEEVALDVYTLDD